jgi:hypothetical protein
MSSLDEVFTGRVNYTRRWNGGQTGPNLPPYRTEIKAFVCDCCPPTEATTALSPAKGAPLGESTVEVPDVLLPIANRAHVMLW